MCLTIVSIPATQSDFLVYKVTKRLKASWDFVKEIPRFRSPLFGTNVIATTGWLLPTEINIYMQLSRERYNYSFTRIPRTKKKKPMFYKNDAILGGVIHSFQSRRRPVQLEHGVVVAYAVDVFAFGSKDVVSRALYIPCVDINKTRRERTIYNLEHNSATREDMRKWLPARIAKLV